MPATAAEAAALRAWLASAVQIALTTADNPPGSGAAVRFWVVGEALRSAMLAGRMGPAPDPVDIALMAADMRVLSQPSNGVVDEDEHPALAFLERANVHVFERHSSRVVTQLCVTALPPGEEAERFAGELLTTDNALGTRALRERVLEAASRGPATALAWWWGGGGGAVARVRALEMHSDGLRIAPSECVYPPSLFGAAADEVGVAVVDELDEKVPLGVIPASVPAGDAAEQVLRTTYGDDWRTAAGGEGTVGVKTAPREVC